MQVTLNSTTHIVEINGRKARVWQGKTASGIDCYALIALIAHSKKDDPRAGEFRAELEEQEPPSMDALRVFDPRLII